MARTSVPMYNYYDVLYIQIVCFGGGEGGVGEGGLEELHELIKGPICLHLSCCCLPE